MACRDTAKHWTDFEQGKLGFWASLGVRFHLALCPHCKAFDRQMRRSIEGVKELPSEPISPETQQDLLRRFRERPKG